MNDKHTLLHRSSEMEALRSRFALRLVARLSEQSEAVPHDVTERLRFARERAIERSRALRSAPATSAVQVSGGAGALSLGGGHGFSSPWWVRLASVLPLVALVAGLVLIQHQHLNAQISAAAEIDTDLLADVVPPAAYSDPGFVEFLKSPRN